MTDDRERAEAVRAVAHILQGRLAPTLDPDHVAALTVDALHAAGWRHVPRPHTATARPGDPPNDTYRQAAAKIRGDHP